MTGINIHLSQGRVARAATAVAVLAGMAFASEAGAVIAPTRDAPTVAGAIADSAPPGSLTGSAFTVIPPTPRCANGLDDDFDGFIDFAGQDKECTSASDDDETRPGEQALDTTGINPAASADTPVDSFPSSGPSYAILSTGDTTIAANANDSPSSGTENRGSNYPAHEGGTIQLYDLVTLRLDVEVPASASCARFRFRFLSEEFTEFVGSGFNDAFLAELDASDFTVDPNTKAVTAPNNFAFDASGRPITVNTAGFSEANAAGTTYDGATTVLAAVTPISPGPHSIFLSIYDVSDGRYDSAVFLDRLELAALPPEDCVRGAQEPQEVLPDPVQGETVNVTPLGGRVRADIARDGMGFFPLEEATQIPVRSRLDTRNGIVQLDSARKLGGIQTATFRSGLFRVLQGKKGDRTTAELGGSLRCGQPPPSGNSRDARRSGRRGRRLWGSGKGHFSSKGKHGSASTRGTVWLLFERCNEVTGTRVKEGTVLFRNFYRRTKRLVQAGETALAVPPKRRR